MTRHVVIVNVDTDPKGYVFEDRAAALDVFYSHDDAVIAEVVEVEEGGSSTVPQAQVTVSGWTCSVEHVGQVSAMHPLDNRDAWRWVIESTTDAAEWMPVRRWEGADLTTPLSRTPDPFAALDALGSFLGAYAEHVDYWGCAHSTGPCPSGDCMAGTFSNLDPEVASEIADEITLQEIPS